MAIAKSVFRGLFSVVGFLLWLVRWPLFLVLCWLRAPVSVICELICIPGLMVWLFSLWAFPEKSEMVWTLGIVSFSAFAMGWIYDLILVALAPRDVWMDDH